MGPGIITASVDNDGGGIAIYSVCGAHFGYSFLWTLFPIMLSLIVIQEMCTRMGVVTGKGLSELIRESYGVKITFLIMILLLLTNITNVMAEFSGIAESLEIFGISKYISIPLSIIILWLLVIRGTYKNLEKIFLVACLF
ncbi:MAG: Nramp family divalent metal transporter, partial [candidate division WOR-3 bacterium]